LIGTVAALVTELE